MRRITAVLIWLTAAGATAVVAWSAVSLAGDQVADRPVRPLSADEVARLPGGGATAAATTTAPVATTRAPAATRAPDATGAAPSTTAGVASPAAAAPTSRPAPASTTSTTAASPPAAPASTSSTAPATTTTTSTTTTTTTTGAPASTATTAAPAPQAYSLVGGRVVVVARAGQVSLVSASPNPGFSMEVAASGPDEVRVRFEGDEHRSEFRARWEGGGLDVDVDEG